MKEVLSVNRWHGEKDALLALPLLNLAHITPGRKKDPFFLNIRNPIPPKVKRIPNNDPV